MVIGNRGDVEGRALKIRNQALLEAREDQLPLYRQYERELFEKTVVINNAFAGANKWAKVPDAAEFAIDFGEIDFPEDPAIELELNTKKLKAGLISLAKYYQLYNADVESEKDAEAAIVENLEKLAALRKQHPTLDEALDYIMQQEAPAKGVNAPVQAEVVVEVVMLGAGETRMGISSEIKRQRAKVKRQK